MLYIIIKKIVIFLEKYKVMILLNINQKLKFLIFVEIKKKYLFIIILVK